MLTREYGPQGWYTTDAQFRTYADPAASSLDWLNLLQDRRYRRVLEAPDLDSAIDAVAKAGYATDPQYAEKLRQIRPVTDAQRKFWDARTAELRASGAPEHLVELGARQSALETGWGRSAPGGNLYGIKADAKPLQVAQAGRADIMPGLLSQRQTQAPVVPRTDDVNGYGTTPEGGDWLTQLAADPRFLLGASILAQGNVGRGVLTGTALHQQYTARQQALAEQQRQRQQEEQQMQMMSQLIGQLPPEQQAAAMADPTLARELLKNSMGMTRRYEMSERGPFDTYTGQVLGTTGQPQTLFDNPYYKQMAQEFDLSKFHPDSVKAAVAAGDPGLLKERLGFSDVMGQREKFEKRLSPLRAASQASAQIAALVDKREGDKGRPFGDVALVYSLVKSLDPESVVREGEVSLMSSAMPLYDKLQTYVGQLKDGGLVGEVTRRDIKQTMDRLNRLYARNAEKLRTEITGIATQYGVDPQMWLGSPIEFPELQSDAPPNGVTIRRIGD